MDGIEHRKVAVNGISMHIAEKGSGPVVLLHGFPELWYTWRHQILGLADRGYRPVAPDLRGYGDSEAPPSHTHYTVFHIVGDIIGLIDSLGQEQVYVVGHDWGAIIAWHLCLFRPDRVKALLNLSVAYRPRNPLIKPIHALRSIYGDDYYICRFQKPGEAEAEFTSTTIATDIKAFLTYRNPGPFMLPKGSLKEFGEHDVPLPCWLTEEDVNFYARKFEKTGFAGGFNYYRALDLNWELTGAWTGAKLQVPVKFIVGDQDLTYNSPGVQDYIHKGGFKNDVLLLQEIVIMEGVGHFINEEKPDEITCHIYDFIQRFEQCSHPAFNHCCFG